MNLNLIINILTIIITNLHKIICMHVMLIILAIYFFFLIIKQRGKIHLLKREAKEINAVCGRLSLQTQM